jgi:phosphatidylserine/phosphatidylglycerophosphate/cardiolipin synthase-like enzyme
MTRLEEAVAAAVDRIGPAGLTELATALGELPASMVPAASARAGFAECARSILAAVQDGECPLQQTIAYLRGVAAGYAQRADAVRVESVWSGPASHRVPVRSTAQVLASVIGESMSELVLATYSAKPYPPILEVLAAAVSRGVTVTVVVETLQGAGSALAGAEPAAAFASVKGIQLWHWPDVKRPAHGGKMHAKIAVADRRLLLVSSANLTQSGIETNIESGVLTRGGTAPARAAEHIAELKSAGTLQRLAAG